MSDKVTDMSVEELAKEFNIIGFSFSCYIGNESITLKEFLKLHAAAATRGKDEEIKILKAALVKTSAVIATHKDCKHTDSCSGFGEACNKCTYDYAIKRAKENINEERK